MPFDKSQPTNTTKIRNLGTVIRPNWDAIELGDASFKPIALNLANRTPAVVPIDPAAIANVYQLYCKEDSHGNKQIYAEDPNAKIMQITNSATPVSAVHGYTWLPGGFLMQWGYVTALAGGGSTNINFVALGIQNFTGTPFSIQTQVRHNGYDDNAVGCVTAGATTGFTLKNSSSSARDFYWLAIGPKV